MESINPATGELVREYEALSSRDVDDAIRAAREGFLQWRETTVAERAALLNRAAEALEASKADLARLMTQEMGKPIRASEAEIEKCALVCRYYAQNAAAFLAPEMVPTEASASYVRFDPIGPVFAIMPWNFPFWQVFRAAAPALAAGNVMLLKHAANVPGCAVAIEETFRRAGFPTGVFTTLLVGHELIDRAIANPMVAGVTLTGSDRAGRAVAAAAGHHLKKVVLELGGSDPFIVLGDANVALAAKAAAMSRTINSGQSCIAAKRFIVDHGVADAFEEAFVRAMRELKVGDPMDPSTDVGPIARLDLLENLHDQVLRSVDDGARVLCGGTRLDRAGFFYAPTVLGGVMPGMAAFEEETFGPVAAISRADSPEHAVRLANGSRYGLGAALWTRDLERAKAIAARLEAGAVVVNGIVKSDPRLPFGGVRESGHGRELGRAGIRAFVNVKTVVVA
ncbi:MAG TPA: NAD-dependent succinate-semialdehyde dehydrogenase [Polyangiaceae bacterium]|nr:NAD-dependent succinate-semialdehyde dehydrogenase [Polyangiaceae bacterium]